ncbi:MAG: hypothetical protein V4717_08260 [Bacteroidota bacterium]
MKHFFSVLLLLALTLASGAQSSNKPAPPKQKMAVKYIDNVDDRMKGPKGEKVFIGPNSGRYYLKNGKKIYVEYKGKKKKLG